MIELLPVWRMELYHYIILFLGRLKAAEDRVGCSLLVGFEEVRTCPLVFQPLQVSSHLSLTFIADLEQGCCVKRIYAGGDQSFAHFTANVSPWRFFRDPLLDFSAADLVIKLCCVLFFPLDLFWLDLPEISQDGIWLKSMQLRFY